VGTIPPEHADTLLDSPFVIARVVGWEGDAPLFEIAFGSGMEKEDVPGVVEMMYELFFTEIQARYNVPTTE
jgi:hypothetical protein